MYEAGINTARKFIAISFTICGIGLVAAANLGIDGLAGFFFLGLVASLFGAFGLFLECLIRVPLEAHKRRGPLKQFSLAELMISMAVIGTLLGIFRVLGWAAIGVLLLLIPFLACGAEWLRLRSRNHNCSTSTRKDSAQIRDGEDSQ